MSEEKRDGDECSGHKATNYLVIINTAMVRSISRIWYMYKSTSLRSNISIDLFLLIYCLPVYLFAYWNICPGIYLPRDLPREVLKLLFLVLL